MGLLSFKIYISLYRLFPKISRYEANKAPIWKILLRISLLHWIENCFHFLNISSIVFIVKFSIFDPKMFSFFSCLNVKDFFLFFMTYTLGSFYLTLLNIAHGGTAIILKNTIKHHELTMFQKDCIEATSIAIEDRKHSISKEKFMEYFETLGPRFIVGGN